MHWLFLFGWNWSFLADSEWLFLPGANINSGADAMKEKFSSELISNKSYYTLFDVDYYLECARTNGLKVSLSELEKDVNIRANTYYNAAYKEFLDILPRFEDIIYTYDNMCNC